MTATVVVAVATLCLVLGAAGSVERSTATAAEPANRFGIGVYTDTPGSPPYAAQLPLAKTLVGERGWTLFFANLLFDQPGNSSSLNPPDPSVAAALHQAYAMNLRPVLRLGQWPRTIRDFADGAAHGGRTSFKQLGQAYRRFVQAMPLPPDGAPLEVLLLNEPNVCGEWLCSGGCNRTLGATEAAHEVAFCLRDLKAALRDLPRLHLGVAPVAQVGFPVCTCCPDAPSAPQNATGVSYIQDMLSVVPDLYADVDFFSSHCYPWGDGPYPGDPAVEHGLMAYRRQASAIGLPASVPILITETGWAEGNETLKAVWTQNMLRDLFFADRQVAGVLPFLLAGPFWESRHFPWTIWANSTTMLGLRPEYEAVRKLRCAEGVGGDCASTLP